MFPVAIAQIGALGTALVTAELVNDTVQVATNAVQILNNAFSENYMIKRLSLELSKNYTTGLKDVNGSIIPQNLGVERLQQIERLIQVLSNEPKWK